jgi:DNA-3-methyladenine glycosylase II
VNLLSEAEIALGMIDPVLGAAIARNGGLGERSRGAYFPSLCRSIIGQQVSVAAATAIFARFEALTGLEPAKVVALAEDEIKAVGLSKQKASYLHDLAAHFVRDPQVYGHLDTLSDEEVIADLTAVKGIGRWTAQMFLMFTLGRPDVFPPDDVGLQAAIKNLYGIEPKKRELEAFAERWKPYRTLACRHLWASLDVI